MHNSGLILDACVAVKWFFDKGEDNLSQALALKKEHVSGNIKIIVPELFYYEVANALRYKKYIPLERVATSLKALFDLSLQSTLVTANTIINSVNLARERDITVYHACYCILAAALKCPLVTANPRQSGRYLPGLRPGPYSI